MADLIDRQAAIKAICEDGTWLERQGCTEITMCERKQRDADILSELPAIEAEPVRRGRWERHYSRPGVYADLFWHCSICGYKNDNSFANRYHHYCPNCGSKMKGEDNAAY